MSSSARIDELRQKFNENPRRYFAPLANEYRKAGDLDQAIFICQEYLPQQPGHMSGHIVYGQALFEAMRNDEARAVFETALSLDPENLIALRHLGDIARDAGNTAEARAWYVRGLDADPRNVEMGALLAALEPAEDSAAHSSADDHAPSTSWQEPETETTLLVESPPSASSHSWLDEELSASSPLSPTPSAPVVNVPMPVSGNITIELPEVVSSSAPTPVVSLRAVAETTAPLEATPFADDLEFTPFGGQAPEADPELEFVDDSESHAQIEDRADGHEPNISEVTEEFEPASTGASETEATYAFEREAADTFEPEATDEFEPGAIYAFESAVTEEPEPERTEAPDAEAAEEFEPGLPVSPRNIATPSQAAPPVDGSSAEPLPSLEVADSPEGAESVAAAEADHLPEESEPTPFVTETMAQLYLSQGHRDQALAIYAQLIEQRPDDPELRARLRAVESGEEEEVVEEPPADRVEGDDFAGPTIREFLQQLFGGYLVLESEIGAAALDTQDPVSADATLDAQPRAQSYAPWPEMEADADSVAPFQQGDGFEEFVPIDSPGLAETAHLSRDDTPTIEGLFAGAPATERDHAAAQLLSDAYTSEEVGVASLRGMPAHPASVELSLDSVFRSEATPRRSDLAPPAGFALDQFFATVGAGAPVPNQANAPSPDVVAQPLELPPDDVEQFNSWLMGLKKT